MASAESVRLYAAGSLKTALSEVARAFEARTAGTKIEAEFAASGLLRERIEKGEEAHVFASADVGHPTKLAAAGLASTKVAIFARNELCAIARQGLNVTPATLLDALLDPGVRVGISTPKADPSGDYAFALFAKAEARKAGARSMLEAKALQLTGGPVSERAPAGRNQYAWVMGSGKADLFIVEVPAELKVGADYGMIVLKNAPASATSFAQFIVGPEGQVILVRHGFGRGDGLQN